MDGCNIYISKLGILLTSLHMPPFSNWTWRPRKGKVAAVARVKKLL